MHLKLVSTTILVFVVVVTTPCRAGENASGQALRESGLASVHASQAMVSGLVASGQAVSVATATPLALSGAVGTASGEAAKALMGAATAPIGTPLTVTEETYTAGIRPDEALQKQDEGPGEKPPTSQGTRF